MMGTLAVKGLKTHFKSDGDFTLPETYLHGCNRSCSLNCLITCLFRRALNDSVFCIHCALFVSQEKRKNLNIYINVGCNNWHNIIEKQLIHTEHKYHKDAIKDSHNLINRFEKPEGTIEYSDTVYLERCNKYSKI